jgi:hypothetical protein
MKQLASTVLYHIGDWISWPMSRFDWAWLYPVYNRIMILSSELDVEKKIWK